jgi:hypothetical protein
MQKKNFIVNLQKNGTKYKSYNITLKMVMKTVVAFCLLRENTYNVEKGKNETQLQYFHSRQVVENEKNECFQRFK